MVFLEWTGYGRLPIDFNVPFDTITVRKQKAFASEEINSLPATHRA